MVVWRVLTCAVVGALMLGLAGCGGSDQEKAQNKIIGAMNDMADILASIKTQADVPDAKLKMDKLDKQFQEVVAEMSKLPAPSAAEEKELKAKWEPKMKDVADRIEKEHTRLESAGIHVEDELSATGMRAAWMK